jgi:hypothetical protein
MADTPVMEKIVSLCKRRGFIYPASEIYGGIRGFWDYGPLGVLLKNNIRDWWWRNMVETVIPLIWSALTPPSFSTPRRGSRQATSVALTTRWWTTAKPKAATAPTT